MVHEIKCSEIWGGIRGDQLEAVTSGVRASLFSRACDGGKGGDIYYFSVCGSDLLTRMAIADVVGHGKLVSDTSQWLYESLELHMNSGDGTEVLADLNRRAVEYGYKAITTAVVAAFYRSDRNLYFSYAGHHDVLHNRKGESAWHAISGDEGEGLLNLPLGVDKATRFVQSHVPLLSGDRLFLYTDGVVEAPNPDGDLFGAQRLIEVLQMTTGEGIENVRNIVLDRLLDHTSGSLQHDDVTFIATEILE